MRIPEFNGLSKLIQQNIQSTFNTFAGSATPLNSLEFGSAFYNLNNPRLGGYANHSGRVLDSSA